MAGSTVEHEREETAGETVRLSDLVERFGEAPGVELFERLDDEYRLGESIEVANIREARQSFGRARMPGHARIVRAARSASRPGAEGNDEMVIIGLSDLEAVVKAATPEFDWAAEFAPRRDLPTSTAPIAIRSGAPGRLLKL
jgi:hypothetical protein